ncbi:alpha/beta hydrolase [Ferviditalea candida]|uniref:Alpha/beta hydrolase n=1 Tax=Ferviditalea candida TaxID=3108399 RepID=A0ABU5ZID1_9BACL|nr:alpha/beta hydrolase [Paenibacillaceae bacterium T2]
MELTTSKVYLPQELESAYIKPRRKKHVLLALLAFLVMPPVLLISFYGYLSWTLARPSVEGLTSDPLKAVGLPYENITFPAVQHQSMLSGWFIPADDSDKTVIFSHGYAGNREEFWIPIYDIAKALHQRHYNVLMFDYGYVGAQPGRVVTAGVKESKELLGAVEFAKSKGADQIFIWGFSMGAGTALQTALSSRDITGMVLDSTFVLEPNTLMVNLKREFKLPDFPTLDMLRILFPLVNGVSLSQIPYEKVKTTAFPMPILMIHGMKDRLAPYSLAEDIIAHQKNPESRLWLLPNRGHERIYRFQPQEYLQQTMQFLSKVSREAKLPSYSA